MKEKHFYRYMSRTFARWNVLKIEKKNFLKYDICENH